VKSFGAAFLLLVLCPVPSAARQTNRPAASESCGGPVFKAGEVTRKARIRHKPVPGFTDEARARGTQGTIRLTAVLCRDGRVTNVAVVQGLPHGMTELYVEAARWIKFDPAHKDGRKVSQSITLEYRLQLDGGPATSEEDSAPQAGRLVEELIIEGNRRLTDEQLLARLRTRPGDVFDASITRRDLQALLDLGTLDTRQTRVSTEAGRRGGVVVIFTVAELPLIRSIEFKGLKSVGESEVLAALAARRPGLRREGVYNPAHVEGARRVVLELLAPRGYKQATVEVKIEEISSVSVSLAFIVNEGPAAGQNSGPGRWF
jgi:TonB family protein